MVRTRYNRSWPRRGFALLWEVKALVELVMPAEVVSLRQLFAISEDWPDDLPAAGGDAIVVAGLEGCLDVLDVGEAERWIHEDLKDLVLSFQDQYENNAGLIFWLPSGRHRISMNAATEQYFWKHRSSGPQGLPLGQLLFSGAEREVERLLDSEDGVVDYDSKHWIGVHLPRIS